MHSGVVIKIANNDPPILQLRPVRGGLRFHSNRENVARLRETT
jgi:hypothetical protein